MAVPSTPANYFHLLRRQITREFRKPLIIFSPKRLLRHKQAVSDLEDFTDFQVTRVYRDTLPDLVPQNSVRKLIYCSGNVYYDLIERRAQENIKDIAILRVEQIAPFPFDLVQETASEFPAAEIWWC